MGSTFRTPAARLVAALGLSLSIVVPPLTLRNGSQKSIEVAAAVPKAVAHSVTSVAPNLTVHVVPRTRRLAAVASTVPRALETPTAEAAVQRPAPAAPSGPSPPVHAVAPPTAPANPAPPSPAPPTSPQPPPAAAPAPPPAPPPPATKPTQPPPPTPPAAVGPDSAKLGRAQVPPPAPPAAPAPQTGCPGDDSEDDETEAGGDQGHGPPSVPPGQAKKGR